MTEPDEISGGREPESPRARQVKLALLLVLAVVVGLAGWSRVHRQQQADPAPTPTATTAAPDPDALPREAAATYPVRFTGPAAKGTGLTLLAAGATVVQVDVDTGASTPIRGAPSTETAPAVFARDGGTVVSGGRPYLVRTGQLTAQFVGEPPGAGAGGQDRGYDGAVPAEQADQFWAYRVGRPGVDGEVRLHGMDGKPRGPAYPLPFGTYPVRGTVLGLLVYTVVSQTEQRNEIWDPATDEYRYRCGQFCAVVAATATEAVWYGDDGCEPARVCTLHRSDLTTGAETGVIRLPGEPAAAALSANGDLAVVVVGHLGPGGREQGQDVRLAPRGGELTAVPGSELSLAASIGLVWAGDTLLAVSHSDGNGDRTSSLAVLPPDGRSFAVAAPLGYSAYAVAAR